MAVQLKISTVTERYIREALARHSLPTPEFRAWRSELEFLLSEDSESCLEEVRTKEGWIFQCTKTKVVSGRSFNVTWDIERSGEQFILLEFRVVAMPPDLLELPPKPSQ